MGWEHEKCLHENGCAQSASAWSCKIRPKPKSTSADAEDDISQSAFQSAVGGFEPLLAVPRSNDSLRFLTCNPSTF